MAIHILHEITKEIYKGQCSSTEKEDGLWSWVDLIARPCLLQGA